MKTFVDKTITWDAVVDNASVPLLLDEATLGFDPRYYLMRILVTLTAAQTLELQSAGTKIEDKSGAGSYVFSALSGTDGQTAAYPDLRLIFTDFVPDPGNVNVRFYATLINRPVY